MELVDIYDRDGNRTGRIHRRGTRLRKGDYVLVVCVWVTDGEGRLLVTRRAPEKAASGNLWENSGGAAQAGETSLQAIARELFEETGIRAEEQEFRYLTSDRSGEALFDFYFLCKNIPIENIVLQKGETTAAKWVTMEELDDMVRRGAVARPIAHHYRQQRAMLAERLNKTR